MGKNEESSSPFYCLQLKTGTISEERFPRRIQIFHVKKWEVIKDDWFKQSEDFTKYISNGSYHGLASKRSKALNFLKP